MSTFDMNRFLRGEEQEGEQEQAKPESESESIASQVASQVGGKADGGAGRGEQPVPQGDFLREAYREHRGL